MAWNDGLSGPHLAIAESQERRIGVQAGPGTGKTSFGLMRRVARVIEEDGVEPERVLLVSFTRVAAADLREKVARLGVRGAATVRATTLHSYCIGLLKQCGDAATAARSQRILLTHERDLMLRDLPGSYGTLPERRKRLAEYAARWAQLPDKVGEPPTPEQAAFERDVQNWLRVHRGMLMEEVVFRAYDYLRNNPSAPERDQFDHVIVDEYQDLNALEQALLEILAGEGSLCVAGDEDQSIYSMRMANPVGIVDFAARDDVEPHEITVCGRCPEPILSMANSLMAHVAGRNKEPLTALAPDVSGQAAVIQWDNPSNEVAGIVAAIRHAVNEGTSPGDILVLTNWRDCGKGVRDGLEAVGVPVRSYFTQEKVTGDKAQAALATLCLLVDPDDAVSLRVILGIGASDGRSAAYQELLRLAWDGRLSPAQVLEECRQGRRTFGRRALRERYVTAMDRLAVLRAEQPQVVIDELFPEGDDDVADLREVCMEALATGSDLAEVLRGLVAAISQDDVPPDPDFVRVMSLHKSKGLTAKVVFVASTVDGILPTYPADPSPADVAHAIAEGRRVFYVAVTRAAERLVISSFLRMTVAEAKRRGVKFSGNVDWSQSPGRVRVQAASYLSELGSAAPAPERGSEWLRRIQA